MLWLRMRPAQRAARFLLLAAWMALITYWSGQGNLPIDQPVVANVLHGFQHRLAHLAAFGLVGLAGLVGLRWRPRAAFWAVLLTSLFGATDEWHQSFTLGRHSGIDDWAWDTACAAIAIYAWTRVRTTRWHLPSPAGAAGHRGDVRPGGRPGAATECAATFGRQRRHATQRYDPGSPRCDRAGAFDPQRRPPASLDGRRLAPALAAGERICTARFKRRHPGWAVDEERVVGARHAAQQRRAAGQRAPRRPACARCSTGTPPTRPAEWRRNRRTGAKA